MELNKLALEDKKLFDKQLSFSRHELAVYSFANICVWQSLFDIRWTLIRGSLCIFFKDSIGCFMYLPPLGKERGRAVIEESFTIMDGINKNKEISRIENAEEPDLEHYRLLGYRCRRKDPDYLCSRSSLSLLRGNKFKSQRALRNYFVKHHDFKVDEIAPVDKKACLELFGRWVSGRKEHCPQELYCAMLEDNRKVIARAFSCYEKLGLHGITVKIDGELKGFTFGYRLNADTFCVLYEITDLSVKGLAQFIFCEFSRRLKGYNHINIMDDSGLENLRKVKLSYKPERTIASYIVTRDA